MWSDANGIELHEPGSKAPARVSNEGGFPNLIGLPDGSMLAAWEQNGSIHLERLP